MKTFREYINIIREAEEVTVIDRPPELTKQASDVPFKQPGSFTVGILNSDDVPGEVALEAVMAVCGLDGTTAMDRIMQAHQGGWAPVKSYGSRDIAETKAHQIMQHAENNTRYDGMIPGMSSPWPLRAEVREIR